MFYLHHFINFMLEDEPKSMSIKERDDTYIEYFQDRVIYIPGVSCNSGVFLNRISFCHLNVQLFSVKSASQTTCTF